MRSVDEWKGKTDDSMPPPHVRLRIWDRENGICHISGRKIRPGEPWDLDHKIALCNGGENIESNLFPALRDKHREKTKLDRAEKKIRDRKRSKDASITKPKHQWPKRKMNGPRVDNTKHLDREDDLPDGFGETQW